MEGRLGRKLPIMELPILLTFSLFLISTHCENLTYLVVAVLKFEILENPIEGEPLNLALPISVAH